MASQRYDWIADVLRSTTGTVSRTLEIGCGAQPYRDDIPGLYIGLDLLSNPYVDWGFLPGDARRLPFRSASFDIVFGVATFFEMPEVSEVFREVLRVVVPGGRFLVFDYQRRVGRRLEATDAKHRQTWTRSILGESLSDAGFSRVWDRSREQDGRFPSWMPVIGRPWLFLEAMR